MEFCQDCVEIGSTKQVKGLGSWSLDDFDTNDDVECFSKSLDGLDIDGLWGDETNSLKVDFWVLGRRGMQIFEACSENESSWKIRIGRNESNECEWARHVPGSCSQRRSVWTGQ